MKGKKDLNRLLKKHIDISRSASKHFLKAGKRETSVITQHEVIIIDGVAKLKTVVSLMPYRRMYTHGGAKQTNPHQMFEIEEDIEP